MDTDIIDSILINLKVLSMIKINEKVSIVKGHLQIDYKPFQCIKRWINKDSRDCLITFLNDLIKKIQSEECKKSEKFSLILNEIGNSLKGINNLKMTYFDDPITIARLDNIGITFQNISYKVN